MKLAHSVCTGEMFVRPELWRLLGVSSLARLFSCSAGLGSGCLHSGIPGRPPGSPLGILFNISGELPKAMGGGCQPYLPPRSSPPAGSAPPAPWGLARKSETQRARGCSPCFPRLPVAAVGTGSANGSCQAQVHGGDRGCSGTALTPPEFPVGSLPNQLRVNLAWGQSLDLLWPTQGSPGSQPVGTPGCRAIMGFSFVGL